MNQRSQTLLAAVALLCGVLLFENTACAQRGRGGDERRRGDNDDERSRGGDDERRDRFSRFFGGGGGFGSGGGDFGGGFPGGGGGWNPWGGGEGGERGDDDGGDSSAGREKQRVTLDLPSGFVAGDLDGDGQVSYYEWRRWQRTGVAEFARWDVNRDGFLTPRELAGVAAPSGGSASPAAAIASSSPSRSGTSSAPATPPSGPSTSVAAVPVSTDGNVDLGSPEAQRAKSYFDLLDTDKDGSVTPEEFGKSRRLKPMFEKAGQPLAQPVQLPQFVQMYLAVVKSST